VATLTPEEELLAFLYEEGYRFMREVPDNGICGLMPMLFTTGLFVDLEQSGYSHRFCYETPLEALSALKSWSGVGDPLEYIVRK
jgi:hypothetical protein